MNEEENTKKNEAQDSVESGHTSDVAPEVTAQPTFSTPAPTKPVPEYYFPPADAPQPAAAPSHATVPPAFAATTPATERPRSKATPVIAAAVVAAIVGGASGAAAALYFSNLGSGTNSSSASH